MVVAGRRKSIAFFIALGVALICIILLLYVGWVLLKWRTGILLFFGILLLTLIIGGVVLNTIFLVREIRRNEQHDAFINAVTHELKTPVASIRLYLETLLTRSVDDKKRADFYRIMLEDSDRLLSTIEQVLRTGRVGPTNHIVNRLPVDLSSTIEESVTRARSLYRLDEKSLKWHAIPNLKVLGDADELQAAVSNLIDNAVKYSDTSVMVEVDAALVDDRHVAISVRDQGMGIPKAELKRIFKRFYRAPGLSTTKIKGTGLGLYIVRSVAKRHGGNAWAESEGLGRGSRIVLRLPVLR